MTRSARWAFVARLDDEIAALNVWLFFTQSLQRLVHRLVLQPLLVGELGQSGRRRPSRFAGLLRQFPRLQAIPAYIVGIGALPEQPHRSRADR
jgi:hypothetical protein